MVLSIIILILNIGVGLTVFYLEQRIEKCVQKDKAYQAEKGKNLATKEDIKEITANIENVKNEISFQKQRNHDFIKERERRFLNILFYAEAVTNAINRLYIYGHTSEDASRVLSLIDDISQKALAIRQESAICFAAYQDVIKENMCMAELVDDIQLLSSELMTRANNVANNIALKKSLEEKAKKEDGITMANTLTTSASVILQNNALLDAPLQYKEKVNNDITQYVLWLNRLYTGGLAINYDVELIKHHNA